MSGNLRKDFQKRNHRERAQPEERGRLGLLEKRKDYKLRAKDHKYKVRKIAQLKQKALDRNPDEFSFKMLSSSVDKAGRKITSRGNSALSMDVVKLLKTQDANYIRTMLQMVKKKRQELEQRITLGDQDIKALKDGQDSRKGKYTVFVDDKEDQDNFKADEWFGTGEEYVDRVWNRPRKQAVKEVAEDDDDDEEEEAGPKNQSKKKQDAKVQAEKEARSVANKRTRTHERVLGHLEAVKERERALMIAEEELEKQRAKMNNSIGGVNKHGVKFKIRERKR